MNRVWILGTAAAGLTLAALAWSVAEPPSRFVLHPIPSSQLAGLALLTFALLASAFVFRAALRDAAPRRGTRRATAGEFRRGFIGRWKSASEVGPVVVPLSPAVPAREHSSRAEANALPPVAVERLQEMLQARLRELKATRTRPADPLDHPT